MDQFTDDELATIESCLVQVADMGDIEEDFMDLHAALIAKVGAERVRRRAAAVATGV